MAGISLSLDCNGNRNFALHLGAEREIRRCVLRGRGGGRRLSPDGGKRIGYRQQTGGQQGASRRIFPAEVEAQSKRSFTSTVLSLRCRQVPPAGSQSCSSRFNWIRGGNQPLASRVEPRPPLLDPRGSASSRQFRDIPLIGLGFCSPPLMQKAIQGWGKPALLTGGQSRVHYCSSSWRTWIERAGSVWRR